ncbi:MAG: DinB family protein [Alphaproteobacteria bacterium]|jgi:uncharacterized damage-inducible protein DinB|nr:DinB family protein [Alphaproteobacteria bacterium]
MDRNDFVTYAHHNRWANGRLYDACAALPDAAYFAPRPAAFFGSLHRTLNHILVGDRAWMHRMSGEGPDPDSLDQELFSAFAPLRQARQAEDERILDFVAALAPADFDRVVAYRTLLGEDHANPLRQLLAHLFNHQTHHRGQAHALVMEAGDQPPALDLIYYLREETATRSKP